MKFKTPFKAVETQKKRELKPYELVLEKDTKVQFDRNAFFAAIRKGFDPVTGEPKLVQELGTIYPAGSIVDIPAGNVINTRWMMLPDDENVEAQAPALEKGKK